MKHVSILLACLFAVNVYADTQGQPAAGTGQVVMGRTNVSRGLCGTADGQACQLTVDNAGGLYLSNASAGIGKNEDLAHAGSDTGVLILGVREDALTLSTSTTGDYAATKTDALGRSITTMAPAGETFQSCGTATAVTSDVAIKAAVASNRIYVTAITCKSTDADNATSIDFKDATTIIAVGGVSQMAATAAGTFTATFPVPLRGTVNTALNFATNIATSSVICCASGYISVN